MNKADCGSTKPRRHFNYRALSAQALRAMQSLKTTEKERAPTEMSRPFAKRVMTIRSALSTQHRQPGFVPQANATEPAEPEPNKYPQYTHCMSGRVSSLATNLRPSFSSLLDIRASNF
jgi:hypothetical protein